MNYPDGTVIPDNLPDSYRPSYGHPKTSGQRCGNCRHYVEQYCAWWNAEVKPDYYCKEWSKIFIVRKK